MIKKLKIIFCIILIICLIIPKLIGLVSTNDNGENYKNAFTEVENTPTFFTDIKNFYISEDESLLIVDYERWGINYISVTDKGIEHNLKYQITDFADFGKDDNGNTVIIFAKDYLMFNYSYGTITYIQNENNYYTNMTDYYNFSFDQYTKNGNVYILDRGILTDTLYIQDNGDIVIIDRTYKFDFIIECAIILAIIYIIVGKVVKKKNTITN